MAKKVTKKENQTFDIEVNRIAYASRVITVEAKNLKEAKKLALEKAPNESFSEHDADYKIE